MIVFFWILFAIVVGLLASSRGRNWFGWILIAAIISPLIAGIILLILPRGNIKKCPACKEAVLKDALVCKHCGLKFENQIV